MLASIPWYLWESKAVAMQNHGIYNKLQIVDTLGFPGDQTLMAIFFLSSFVVNHNFLVGITSMSNYDLNLEWSTISIITEGPSK